MHPKCCQKWGETVTLRMHLGLVWAVLGILGGMVSLGDPGWYRYICSSFNEFTLQPSAHSA